MPTPPPQTATAPPDAEWALVADRLGLSADAGRAAVAWWELARQPGEGATAFLVRHGVLLKRAVKEVELVRKGYVALPDFRHLIAAGGLDRLRELSAASAPASASHPAPPPAPAAAPRATPAPPPRPTTPATVQGSDAPTEAKPALPADEPPRTAQFTPSELTKPLAPPTPRTPLPRPAPAPAVPRGPEVGQVIGKCLLTERVGEGGSGVVFRALHQGFNIPVAVKLLRTSPEGVLTVRLGHEAQLLARLNHPHIVRVWDFDDAASPPYLVLEWVDGLSLEDLIRQSGRLSVARAVRVIGQVAAALAEAHRVGIVHRDVKPANVLLTRDGAAKLADLGLAVAAADRPAGGRTVDRASIAGTVSHMGPELFTGAAPDHRSDMYALGVSFYQALTGQLPFPGPSRMQFMIQHAEDAPRPPHELFADVPPAVSAVVMRLLEKDPDARFATYAELTAALAAAERPAADGPATPLTSSPPPPLQTDLAPVPPPPDPPTEEVPLSARRSLWRNLLNWKRGSNDGEPT